MEIECQFFDCINIFGGETWNFVILQRKISRSLMQPNQSHDHYFSSICFQRKNMMTLPIAIVQSNSARTFFAMLSIQLSQISFWLQFVSSVSFFPISIADLNAMQGKANLSNWKCISLTSRHYWHYAHQSSRIWLM